MPGNRVEVSAEVKSPDPIPRSPPREPKDQRLERSNATSSPILEQPANRNHCASSMTASDAGGPILSRQVGGCAVKLYPFELHLVDDLRPEAHRRPHFHSLSELGGFGYIKDQTHGGRLYSQFVAAIDYEL